MCWNSNQEIQILLSYQPFNGGEGISEELQMEFAQKCLENLDQAFKEANQYMAELRDPDVVGCSINIMDPSGFKMRLHRRSKKEVK